MHKERINYFSVFFIFLDMVSFYFLFVKSGRRYINSKENRYNPKTKHPQVR